MKEKTSGKKIKQHSPYVHALFLIVLIAVITLIVGIPLYGIAYFLRAEFYLGALPAVLLGLFLWIVVLWCVSHIAAKVHNGKQKDARGRWSEVHDEVMQALERITSGDFDVLLEANERGYFNDIATQINQMAQSLGSMEQMRQDFVSNVSHEIQSPLTSISGFAALLQQEELPPERRSHYLSIIEAESRRLSRLGDNLLRLSMLDNGQKTLNHGRYRLDRQLQSVMLLLEPQWQPKGITPVLDLKPIEVWADEELMEQVWINLVHNAIKFTPEGGEITISLAQQGHNVACTVRDNGPGIAPEYQMHLFERFYKVDKARERAAGGNGLGLSLVHSICRLHGGSVRVQSEESAGAAFTVQLPMQPKTECSPPV